MFRSYKYRVLLLFTLTSFCYAFAKPDESESVQTTNYAKNFRITEFTTHRIATVHFGENNSKTSYNYALVPKDAPLPELPADIPIIRTPVQRVVVLETVHIGFLDALGQLDTIVGAGTTNYICNPTIRKRIETGAIQKIATAQTLNIERLLLLKPELILTSIPVESALNVPEQLARAGLPAVTTAAYKEAHPLARAEWIRFIAAFFDASEAADETFNAVADRYETLLQIVNAIEKRPTVFCGAPYSGVWHIAGGDSYIAQLIRDAGGDYLWSEVPGADAIPLNTERVFLKAANADIWLNPGIYRSRSSLFSADARFENFHAAKTGHIYNHTRQQTTQTGNPIWETGVVHPDDVLADLIKLFHPVQLPDRKFVYYEKLD